MADLARRQQQPAVELLPAPAALRPAIAKLWSVLQQLVPSPLPIAAAVGVWVRDHGLAEDDALDVLADVTAPAVVAGLKYPSDVLTEMARRVDAATRVRREAERVEAERRQRERYDAEKAPPETVRDLLARWRTGGTG